jgi:hypothetical protein
MAVDRQANVRFIFFKIFLLLDMPFHRSSDSLISR